MFSAHQLVLSNNTLLQKRRVLSIRHLTDRA